jgi:hypothetical protein
VFGRPLARGGRRSSPVHLCSTHKVCGSDDKTPATTSCRLPSAQLGLAEAINTAAEQAIGRSNLTSLEIDLANGDTVVWQIKFGGKVTTGPPQRHIRRRPRDRLDAD